MGDIPEAGNQAPDFELPDSTGEKHTLTSLVGKEKVVLVFFRGLW